MGWTEVSPITFFNNVSGVQTSPTITYPGGPGVFIVEGANINGTTIGINNLLADGVTWVPSAVSISSTVNNTWNFQFFSETWSGPFPMQAQISRGVPVAISAIVIPGNFTV